ncbi:hypothetical protein [Streptomyces sp. NPDC059957]|uniref:hypothetical protein n=1 Tax=Streptomyces sp. NPDC059957 TaxID=3347016 RepID=UPI0036466822
MSSPLSGFFGSPAMAFADGGDGDKLGVVAPKNSAAADIAPRAARNQFFGSFVSVQPGQNKLATLACPSGQARPG